MRTSITNGTPGYPLSGAFGMCAALEAQHATARKRVRQLAVIGTGIQGTGVSVGTADLPNAVPTTVSASTSERSPG